VPQAFPDGPSATRRSAGFEVARIEVLPDMLAA
jgi:hypothetical protein